MTAAKFMATVERINDAISDLIDGTADNTYTIEFGAQIDALEAAFTALQRRVGDGVNDPSPLTDEDYVYEAFAGK